MSVCFCPLPWPGGKAVCVGMKVAMKDVLPSTSAREHLDRARQLAGPKGAAWQPSSLPRAHVLPPRAEGPCHSEIVTQGPGQSSWLQGDSVC